MPSSSEPFWSSPALHRDCNFETTLYYTALPEHEAVEVRHAVAELVERAQLQTAVAALEMEETQ